jgi:hypothetical protein
VGIGCPVCFVLSPMNGARDFAAAAFCGVNLGAGGL